jgi:hypothetical protein
MKLFLDTNLNINSKKTRILAEFCIFCADYLPIEGEFTINVVSEREPHGIGTTAAYYVAENTCSVYGKNRALPDIMRSIAHEMTHMMQDQVGLIKGPIRDAGGFHEDQANARAGELLKLFVKNREDKKLIYERKN